MAGRSGSLLQHIKDLKSCWMKGQDKSQRSLDMRRSHIPIPRTRPVLYTLHMQPTHLFKTKRPLTRVQNALVDASSVVGHGIIYFTLFYCTFNWYTYRQAGKHINKKDTKRDTKKENKDT